MKLTKTNKQAEKLLAQSERKIRKAAAFESANRLDRFIMHRLDASLRLSENEARHFQRLRLAYLHALNLKISTSQRESAVMNDCGVSREKARTLLSQVAYVYETDLLRNAEMEKNDIAAKLHAAIERCEQRDTVEDDNAIARITSVLKEVRGWEKAEDKIKVGDIQLPIPIWSTDLGLLQENQTQTEETEYEELESEINNENIDDE